jgi:TPR repeat protein
MIRYFLTVPVLAVLLFSTLAPAPVRAENNSAATLPAERIKYYPDPVYQKLNSGDSHPMDEMLDLAKAGDVRAQFILGDLYSKGKGGLPRDVKESRRWFEASALHGYNHSFIRLAALAKHTSNPIEAYQWYTLAIERTNGDEKAYAREARKGLVTDKKLTPEDINKAEKLMDTWKDTQDALRRREQAEQKKAAIEKADQAKIQATQNRLAGDKTHDKN